MAYQSLASGLLGVLNHHHLITNEHNIDTQPWVLSLMFQDLISFDVNENFASVTNPQGMWMKLSIILRWILTPLPRWWCSLAPLYLVFFTCLIHRQSDALGRLQCIWTP